MPAGYSRTPLAKKLGIKPSTVVALIDAPAGFAKTLDGLPEGVTFATKASTSTTLVVWFVTSRRDLEKRIVGIAKQIQDGYGLWVAWPKKASGMKTDLTENLIRDTALPLGIVDYKVCAVSDVWSGLKFARRKK